VPPRGRDRGELTGSGAGALPFTGISPRPGATVPTVGEDDIDYVLDHDRRACVAGPPSRGRAADARPL